QGGFYSRYYRPDLRGGVSTNQKVVLELQPTYRPFRFAEDAARQIEQVVIVYFVLARVRDERVAQRGKPGSPAPPDLKPEQRITDLRQAVSPEVKLVLDSLRSIEAQSPQALAQRIKLTLQASNHEFMIGTRAYRILELLPKDDEFWLTRDGSWQKQVERW